MLDERDPRALGAEPLSNNVGELWSPAEALLWLKDESNDSGRVPVAFSPNLGHPIPILG